MAKGILGYTLKDDAESAKDVFLQSSDLWIAKMLLDNVNGVLDLTDPNAATLTPATAPGWVSGAYDGLTLIIAGHEVPIISSSDTAIVFDSTDVDGLVDGSTCAFRVQSELEWAGDSEGKSFEQKDETIPFKTGVPRKTKFTDLLERTVTLKGKLKMLNSDILAALLGLKDASIDAAPEADPPVVGQTIKTAGSNPSSFNDKYKLVFKTASRMNKVRQFENFYCDFRIDGSIEMDSDGWKMAGFTANVLSDPLRVVANALNQDTDFYQIKTID